MKKEEMMIKNYILDDEDYDLVINYDSWSSENEDSDLGMIDLVNRGVGNFYALDYNCAGGNLHIVLDDGNLEDKNVLLCLQGCIKEGDFQGILMCSLLGSIPEEFRFKYLGNDNKYHS